MGDGGGVERQVRLCVIIPVDREVKKDAKLKEKGQVRSREERGGEGWWEELELSSFVQRFSVSLSIYLVADR